MSYIVIEIQTYADGSVGNLVTAHETLNEAEAKFHLVLAAAAVSELPLHAASLLQADGRLLNCQSYEHPLPAPEQETETEPEVSEDDGESS